MVKPIKIGVLQDAVIPGADSRFDGMGDWLKALELTFEESLEQGVIDRPIEMIHRKCEGLPTGDSDSVINAWKELAAEGCLLILGPTLSENAPAVRQYVDAEGKRPTLTWAGADECLGEWVFAVNNGSMAQEPFQICNAMAADGVKHVAIFYENNFSGMQYVPGFRAACKLEELEVVAEIRIGQFNSGEGKLEALAEARAAGADSILLSGSAFGGVGINDAKKELGWDVQCYAINIGAMSYSHERYHQDFMGWVYTDHYDEGNPVGQAFLDRFGERYGHRPEYYFPLLAHDMGRVIAHGCGHAHPLTPLNVKNGLEQGVRMIPAACGSADNRLNFGPWQHKAWQGTAWQICRKAVPGMPGHVFHHRPFHAQ